MKIFKNLRLLQISHLNKKLILIILFGLATTLVSAQTVTGSRNSCKECFWADQQYDCGVTLCQPQDSIKKSFTCRDGVWIAGETGCTPSVPFRCTYENQIYSPNAIVCGEETKPNTKPEINKAEIKSGEKLKLLLMRVIS